MDDYSFIEKNILTVSDKIYAAAKRAGRDPKDITLICVSKTKPVEMVAKAYECGRRDFGENKVQEITLKHPQLPSDTVWHMIGHLQKNKVKKAVALSEYIHSVDSADLAQAIDSEAGKFNFKTILHNKKSRKFCSKSILRMKTQNTAFLRTLWNILSVKLQI